LSYAPTANGTVGTNLDYSIGLALFCSHLLPISPISLDAILISGATPARQTWTNFQHDSQGPSPAARDLTRAIFCNRSATFWVTLGLGFPEERFLCHGTKLYLQHCLPE